MINYLQYQNYIVLIILQYQARNLIAFQEKIRRISASRSGISLRTLISSLRFVSTSFVSLYSVSQLRGSSYSVNGEHFPSAAKSLRNKVLRDLLVYR